MKEHYSVITRKGQVTVPAEVRRRLRLERGDRIAFVVNDADVRLVKKGSVVAATAGIFKTDQPPLSAEQLRAAAEQAIADEGEERGRA